MAVQMPEDSSSLHTFPLYDITPEGHCACWGGATCKDIGKHPMVRWRQWDEEGGRVGPGGSFGIPTGLRNGIFVVDLDRKDGKDGVASFIALAAGRPVPETASVLTPTGGAHLYFRYPKNLVSGYYIPNSKGELGVGVDVRGDGGYVVGPGSKHKKGGIYQELPGAPAEAPMWLLELVVKPFREKVTPTEHRTVDPSSPEGVRAVAWARTYLAERAEISIEGQDGSGRFFHVCCHLMYSALPLDTLQEIVEEVYNPRCLPPWSQGEIEHKLSDADELSEEPRGLCSPDFLLKLAGRTSETGPQEPDPAHEYTFSIGMRGSGTSSKASFGEVAADLFDHVQWAGVFSLDTFRDKIVATNPPMKLEAEANGGLTDNDVQLVRAWLEYHGKKLQVADVRAAIETVARLHPFDPRQDYLQEQDWDGVHRLDRVLPDYFNTPDTEYTRGIGPRWFISLVARAMTPGCQSDCTLILEGPQGIGKSSAFRALMPDPTWYADTSSGVEALDFKQNLLGIWLEAFDELDSLTRASLTKVKTLLTSTTDHYRKSYGRLPHGYPRTVGFCGSTNTKQYFNDPTGSRRFWPTPVLRQIVVARIVADRDQLWAEAYYRWKQGEPWHANTPELLKLCEEEQETRLETDPWEEAIREWLNNPAKVSWIPVAKVEGSPYGGGLQLYDASRGVTVGGVLKGACGKEERMWTAGDSQRVGRILQHRLHMERIQVRVGKLREWRYVFPIT